MRITFSALGAAALLLLGCGDVSTTSASSASTGPGGSGPGGTGAGGATSSASASSTGQGGAGGQNNSTTVSVSASSTGAGGGSPCADGYVDIDGDGPTKHLAAPCNGTWAANVGAKSASGYLGYLGKGGPKDLFVEACGDPGPTGFPVFRFNVQLQGQGMVSAGTSYYAITDSETYSTSTDVTVNVTGFELVGGHITGDFKTTVTGMMPAQPKMLTGKFKVCHVEDEPPPP